MSANNEFGRGLSNGAAQKEQLVRDAQRMVRFAAEPVQPGESIGAQILKASKALEVHYGAVRRAWYGLSGPEIYPTIYAAWARLVERRAQEQRNVAAFAEVAVILEKALERNRPDTVSDQPMVLEPRAVRCAISGKG